MYREVRLFQDHIGTPHSLFNEIRKPVWVGLLMRYKRIKLYNIRKCELLQKYVEISVLPLLSPFIKQ